MFAQTATLRGQVTDESGAIVPGANVTLAAPAGFSKVITAANDGSYAFANLQPGDYTVQASAPSLILLRPATISLKAGIQTLNLLLNVSLEKQEVTVDENSGPTVSTEASNNASALVMRGNDLDALSDNPDDLQADLAGARRTGGRPNGGSSISTASAAANCRLRTRFARSASTRIRFRRSTTSWDTVGSRSLPSRARTSSADPRLQLRRTISGTRAILTPRRRRRFMLHEMRGTVSGPINKRASFTLNVVGSGSTTAPSINGVTLDPADAGGRSFHRTRRRSAPDRSDSARRLPAQANHTLTCAIPSTATTFRTPGRRVQPGFARLSSRHSHAATPCS